MTLNQASVRTVRWSVMWLGKRGYMAEKEFENDFGGALAAYVKLTNAGKKWVTLRSMNVGFDPPVALTHHEVEKWRVVTHKGKKYKKKYIDYINLLEELNDRGKFWCPYCIQLREFVKAEDEVNLMCPACEATTRDFHIRHHNPKALAITFRRQGRRSGQRRIRARTRKR